MNRKRIVEFTQDRPKLAPTVANLQRMFSLKDRDVASVVKDIACQVKHGEALELWPYELENGLGGKVYAVQVYDQWIGASCSPDSSDPDFIWVNNVMDTTHVFQNESMLPETLKELHRRIEAGHTRRHLRDRIGRAAEAEELRKRERA